MIVYQADKRAFRDDILSNRIEEKILKAFMALHGHGVSASEVKSWKHSLGFMDRIIEAKEIPDDVGIAVEMGVPQSGKRMDFVLTGLNAAKRKVAIIVELKQWESAQRTAKDGIVETFLRGAQRETNHPSYQAWSYATMLEDFNEAVRDLPIALRPCAYLHNCENGSAILHEFYREHTTRAPAFLKDDALRLREFIQENVQFGDRGETLYEIVNGRIRPSKSLADNLASLLKGNREFVLIDDQKLVYETALDLAKKAASGQKQTLIVEGGPGTGKTVVAINLLVELIRGHLNVQYVTRNAAPRSVYESKLSGEMKKTRISNLFRSSGSYYQSKPDTFDVLVVDEAHRLNKWSGFYGNQGENQIKELIAAARLTIFFIDDAQRVTMDDIGSVEAIRTHARDSGSEITETKLESQFRCGGSDGYLAWVDHTLGIRATANQTLAGIRYEVVVCDSASDLRSRIRAKNALTQNRARMVAGYCWPWNSKKSPGKMDIILPEENFAAQWNFASDQGLWILKEHSVEQIGCIHTCQGLELDYIGVIFGHDLVIRKGEWVEFPDRRAKADRSIKGYYKLAMSDHLAAQRRAREIIRNTYRTLMTRGLKGCFLYSVDLETNTYLKQAASAAPSASSASPSLKPALPFEILTESEARPYENCVPCFDSIRVAAGAFASGSLDGSCLWVRLNEALPPRRGYFVARLVGESMNRRIPNGSWCLFRANPEGSRNGRVVLVQHRDIQDPDTGSCTVKIYHSQKSGSADEWRHSKIVLSPESSDVAFKPLILEPASDSDYRVIGELIAVLS